MPAPIPGTRVTSLNQVDRIPHCLEGLFFFSSGRVRQYEGECVYILPGRVSDGRKRKALKGTQGAGSAGEEGCDFTKRGQRRLYRESAI